MGLQVMEAKEIICLGSGTLVNYMILILLTLLSMT